MFRRSVLAGAPDGLSFLGELFDRPRIALPSLTSGDRLFDGSGSFAGDHAVGVNDVIFGQPTQIPLPGGVLSLGGASLALAGLRRRT